MPKCVKSSSSRSSESFSGDAKAIFINTQEGISQSSQKLHRNEAYANLELRIYILSYDKRNTLHIKDKQLELTVNLYDVMQVHLHCYEMKCDEKLTVQLLVQSLDLPRLLDQTDGFAVDVGVGLVGPINSDACKQAREPCSWPVCRCWE